MTSVYVIAAKGGPVKVGMARDPQARLQALRTGTPYQLRLAYAEDVGDLNARKIESAVHVALSQHHAHGEWFAVEADQRRCGLSRPTV